MKHISRPSQSLHRLGLVTLAAGALCLMGAARTLHAQARSVIGFFANPFPSLSHTSQGYLGVEIEDLDQEKAQQLKLKDVRGAVITLIDHDAPAGKIGLKVNDVVISLNGQTVEGAEQLKRMLHEIPAGRKVSMEISRDGNIQTIAVELADRAAMEHDVWDKIDKDGNLLAPISGMGILGANGDVSGAGGFHMPFVGSSSLKVGAITEPLTSQMAEYLGVNGGLMVKQVARKSEAAHAGLHAFDVILKVGNDAINTSADWERALRSNEGKQVQVTILRDKKQQTLNLQVDSKRHGELEIEDLFGDGDASQLAFNDLFDGSELDPTLLAEAEADAASAQTEMQKRLGDTLQHSFDGLEGQLELQAPQLSQQQSEELEKRAEEMARDAEKFSQQFKDGQLPFDQKQMEQLKQQMQQFKVDPKQTEELRKQMEQFQKSFNLDQFKQQFEMNQKQKEEFEEQLKQWQKQLNDNLKNQMEYWNDRQPGHFV